MTSVLGLDDAGARSSQDSGLSEALDTLVQDLLRQRQAVRAEKNWGEADRLRDLLAAAGVVVEDSAAGPRWSLKA